MKIYITGATGFIGSNLTKRLIEEGNTVHALIRNPAKSKKINFENVTKQLYLQLRTNKQSIEIAKNALLAIKKADMTIELNVAGYRKPIGEAYPSLSLLKQACSST